jgi:hypothetical protein
VERGKVALARILATALRADATSFGLLAPGTESWHETRIWCACCGRHRLEGHFRPQAGELLLRCPVCSPSHSGYLINAQWGTGFADLRTIKPAVSRVLSGIHMGYRLAPVDGAIRCGSCNTWVPIRRGRLPWIPADAAADWSGCIYQLCPGCGQFDGEMWHSLTWSLPEARRFWQANPRMRYLPEREVEAGGLPAMVTGFESLTGSARLEVVTLRDSLQVVCIHGPGSGADDERPWA